MSESARAEAFAKQADRSRELAAGYVQQAINNNRVAQQIKTEVETYLKTIAIPHRWVGYRLDLLGPDGQWVNGPELRGTDGISIAGAEISEAGRLILTLTDDTEFDAGVARGEGDFVKDTDTSDDIIEGESQKFATAGEKAKLARISVTGDVDLDDLKTKATSAVQLSQLGTSAGKIPVLDDDGKLLASLLPSLGIIDVNQVASQAAMLALNAQKGDVAVRTDLNKTFMLADSPASTLANWVELRTPTDAVLAVAGLTGTITAEALRLALGLAAVATSGDYGDLSGRPTLGDSASRNVGTTAGTVAAGDDSRITGAQQTSEKGAANGYAGLDSNGRVPNAQLPTSLGAFSIGDFLETLGNTPTDGTWLKADGKTYLKSAYPTLAARVGQRYANWSNVASYAFSHASPKLAQGGGFWIRSNTTTYRGTTGQAADWSGSPVDTHGIGTLAFAKYLNGNFILMSGANIRTSVTGASGTWSTVATGIAASGWTPVDMVYTGSVYLIAGFGSTAHGLLYESAAIGTSWTVRNGFGSIFTTSSLRLRSIAFGDGRLVGVGDSGKIAISFDNGQTATEVRSPTTANLKKVLYGNGVFVAFGDGVVLVSPDGMKWRSSRLIDFVAAGTSWTAIDADFNGSFFSFITGSGTSARPILISEDGDTFINLGNGSNSTNAVVTSDRALLATGSGSSDNFFASTLVNADTEFTVPSRRDSYIKAAA